MIEGPCGQPGCAEANAQVGWDSCPHFDLGYLWCRPCEEHHRPPECAIDEDSNALGPDGKPW